MSQQPGRKCILDPQFSKSVKAAVKAEVTVGTREPSEIHRLKPLIKVRLSALLSSVLESVLMKRFRRIQADLTCGDTHGEGVDTVIFTQRIREKE